MDEIRLRECYRMVAEAKLLAIMLGLDTVSAWLQMVEEDLFDAAAGFQEAEEEASAVESEEAGE